MAEGPPVEPRRDHDRRQPAAERRTAPGVQPRRRSRLAESRGVSLTVHSGAPRAQTTPPPVYDGTSGRSHGGVHVGRVSPGPAPPARHDPDAEQYLEAARLVAGAVGCVCVACCCCSYCCSCYCCSCYCCRCYCCCIMLSLRAMRGGGMFFHTLVSPAQGTSPCLTHCWDGRLPGNSTRTRPGTASNHTDTHGWLSAVARAADLQNRTPLPRLHPAAAQPLPRAPLRCSRCLCSSALRTPLCCRQLQRRH